jgi:hypothetical protein
MIQKPIGWYFPKHISQSIEKVDKFIDSKFDSIVMNSFAGFG